MRTIWHGQRLLMIDRSALNTLNALSLGYALPVERGGKTSREPEPGIARVLAEALETMVAALDKQDEAYNLPAGANVAYNASGRQYVSANPGRG